MNTNSGLWRIENETRYSTEDIVALFNDYEALLAANGEVQATYEGAGPGVFRFRDYSPASRTVTRRSWDGTRYAEETLPNFVRSAIWGAQTEHVIGLIKPSMLYESPLEALAAVSDGAERTPSGFSESILREAVRYGYRSQNEAWRAYEQVVWAGRPEVRIHAKRESRKTTKPVKGIVVRHLRDKVGEALSTVARAEVATDTLLDRFVQIQDLYSSIDLPCSIEREAIEDVVRATVRLRAQLDAAYSSLNV